MSASTERRRDRFRSLGTAVTVTLLLGLIALATATQVVPRVLGGTSLTVLTGSMKPTFDPGDVIIVAEVDPADVKVGDIVTFQPISDNPLLITHRVVGKSVGADGELQFITQGDANGAADAPIVADQIKARYVYHLPWLGHVVEPFDGRGPLVATGIAIALIAYGIWCFVPRPQGRRGRRRTDDPAPTAGPEAAAAEGSALTRSLAIAALTGALAVSVVAPAPAARADGIDVAFTGPTVQLDWRGQTYSTTETSFFGSRTIVPGDSIARQTRITNSYSSPGLLTVNLRDVQLTGAIPDGATLRWSIDNGTGSRELRTVTEGTTPILTDVVVGAGSSVLLTLQLDYPFASTDIGRSAENPYRFGFNVEYLLRQQFPDAPPAPVTPKPLPDTGSTLQLWQIATGVGALLAGFFLVALARRRRDDDTDTEVNTPAA